jgi:ATP-dependent Clp protease ATP-binding subunit ClpA
VRVVVVGDDKGAKKLGFVFPEGPVLPRPERDIIEAGKKRAAEELGRDNEATPPDAEEPGSSPESVRN